MTTVPMGASPYFAEPSDRTSLAVARINVQPWPATEDAQSSEWNVAETLPDRVARSAGVPSVGVSTAGGASVRPSANNRLDAGEATSPGVAVEELPSRIWARTVPWDDAHVASPTAPAPVARSSPAAVARTVNDTPASTV
jgi:hypothetical protein